MPGSTPIFGFPYPDPSDLVANYPALGQQLAEDIEDVLPTVPGLMKITSQTFTTVAAVNVNNCFTSTFESYLVIIDFLGSGTLTPVNMRMRVSATDNSSSNYNVQQIVVDNTSITGLRTASGTSALVSAVASTYRTRLSLNFLYPSVAAITSVYANSQDTGTGLAIVERNVSHNVATAYDGFSFFPNAGTITGSLKIYGFRN